MGQMLLLVLMSCGISRVIGTLNPSKIFYFVNETKAFDEAQQYCRDTYTDLVTLWDRAGMEELFALEDFTFTGSAWIGLRNSSRQLWQWSLSDQEFYKDGETEYRNWGPGQPESPDRKFCALMNDTGYFRDGTCRITRSFICYNGQNNSQKYILINETKSWREAQSYCRQFHTDLASVRNPDENLQIQQLVPPGGEITYFGLFKDAFAWSDNSTSSFRNWDLDQPDGSGECVAQQLQDRRLWEDQACSSPRPFFCYAIPVVKQVLRLELESDQNVNNPDVMASILQEIKQKLISLGMPETSNLQWRQQPNGNVFQGLLNAKPDIQLRERELPLCASN